MAAPLLSTEGQALGTAGVKMAATDYYRASLFKPYTQQAGGQTGITAAANLYDITTGPWRIVMLFTATNAGSCYPFALQKGASSNEIGFYCGYHTQPAPDKVIVGFFIDGASPANINNRQFLFPPVTIGESNLFEASYNGTTTITLRLNGQAVGSITVTLSIPSSTVQVVTVNKNSSTATSRYGLGQVWMGAVVVGWWKFNETSGTTVLDYSGNNNPITLTGTMHVV